MPKMRFSKDIRVTQMFERGKYRYCGLIKLAVVRETDFVLV